MRPRVPLGSALTASTLLIGVTACGDRTDVLPSNFTVRVSAGVSIVESTACAWGSAGPLSIAEEPYLTIGEPGDNVPYRFIEITDAMTLPDGRIAVAEQGSGQVRVYDTEGTHLVSFGRAGDGEGEFRSITGLIWWEDRLWAFDRERALLSSFGGLRNLERVERVPPAGPDLLPVEDLLVLDDGTMLGFEGLRNWSGDGLEGPSSSHILRDTARIVRLGPAGEAVLTFAGTWRHELRNELGATMWSILRNTALPSWTTDGTRLYYTSGDRFDVSVADAGGTVRRIQRRAEQAPRPTEADLAAWREQYLPPAPLPGGSSLRPPELMSRLPQQERARLEADAAASDRRALEDRARAEAALEEIVWPDAMPVYEELLADPRGSVWARRAGELDRVWDPSGFDRSGSSARDWDVYGENGACLGTVRMPEGLMVFEIGEDYVLGRTEPQSDAERIQLHRLSGR